MSKLYTNQATTYPELLLCLLRFFINVHITITETAAMMVNDNIAATIPPMIGPIEIGLA